MLVRSSSMADTMSRYLIQRIQGNPGIEVLCSTEVSRLAGKSRLEELLWIDKGTGETVSKAIRHVFVMTGASPNTEWLRNSIALDSSGFILTGQGCALAPERGCSFVAPEASASAIRKQFPAGCLQLATSELEA